MVERLVERQTDRGRGRQIVLEATHKPEVTIPLSDYFFENREFLSRFILRKIAYLEENSGLISRPKI